MKRVNKSNSLLNPPYSAMSQIKSKTLKSRSAQIPIAFLWLQIISSQPFYEIFTWEKIVSAIRYSYLKGTGRPAMNEAHSFRLALH